MRPQTPSQFGGIKKRVPTGWGMGIVTISGWKLIKGLVSCRLHPTPILNNHKCLFKLAQSSNSARLELINWGYNKWN